MKALVTGGGGFLGRAVIERLLARGDDARSFARGDYPELRQAGVEVTRGDLGDADALGRAVRGCGPVIHPAANVGVTVACEPSRPTNVAGPRQLREACPPRAARRGAAVLAAVQEYLGEEAGRVGAPQEHRPLSRWKSTNWRSLRDAGFSPASLWKHSAWQ